MNAVDDPIKAVTHIQNTAPAPPAETAATTPTRFPIPTRVAVETISVWNVDRLSLCSFLASNARTISGKSRIGKNFVRIVK